MRKRISKIIFWLILLVLLLTAGGLFAFRLIDNKAPVEEIKRAREYITLANKNNAHKYAKDLLERSTVLYDSAMVCWNKENKQFILFRDYSHIKYLAIESAKLSEIASQKALSNSFQFQNELRIELSETHKRITDFKSNFNFIPQENLWKQFNKGKLKFEEARAEFENDQLFESRKKLAEAKLAIDKCYIEVSKNLDEYFNQFPEWHKISNAAINESKNNKTYVIIVDKFARECILYYKGTFNERFKIELGKNWMGSKKHSGDFSTPEGSYKIIDKKQNGRTKFYKALLLNYPNNEDKQRFQDNQKKGVVSKNKSIGGLIEIHGGGDQGADWTDGCIALSNTDMDKLYSKVNAETPVIIVGSLIPLDSLLK